MSGKNKKLYSNGKYEKANPTWHEEDSPWKVEQIHRVFNFQSQNQHTTIYEIGCGIGGILATLDDSLQILGIHTDMVGFDISSIAIERARIKYNERQNITFEYRDVLTMDRLECDLCLLIDVLEHIEDPKGFLIELSKRGIREFVIRLPLENTWIGNLRGKTNSNKSMVGHLHFYDKYKALSLLREANLKINTWLYTPDFEIDIKFHRTFLSVIAYLPRKVLFNIWPNFTAQFLGGVSLISWCSSV